MKSYDIFQHSFFIGKKYMFEHRKLTKNVFCNVLLDFEKKGSKLTILSVGFLNSFQ